MAAVVGDGEAETGPLATSWHISKFLSPIRDGAVLLWVTGYAVLATMVAVLLRSVPLALGVGIAWAGPFEHLLQDAWKPARKRSRKVTMALKAYAALTTSAARGAVRVVPE